MPIARLATGLTVNVVLAPAARPADDILALNALGLDPVTITLIGLTAAEVLLVMRTVTGVCAP